MKKSWQQNQIAKVQQMIVEMISIEAVNHIWVIKRVQILCQTCAESSDSMCLDSSSSSTDSEECSGPDKNHQNLNEVDLEQFDWNNFFVNKRTS